MGICTSNYITEYMMEHTYVIHGHNVSIEDKLCTKGYYVYAGTSGGLTVSL